MTPHKRPAGRPPLTWVAVITKDITKTLTHHNIKKPLTKKSLEKLSVIARDNSLWRREIVRNMEDALWEFLFSQSVRFEVMGPWKFGSVAIFGAFLKWKKQISKICIFEGGLPYTSVLTMDPHMRLSGIISNSPKDLTFWLTSYIWTIYNRN